MKQSICLGLSLLLVLFVATVASAEGTIMPRYTYVSKINSTLSISSGTASAVGLVTTSQKLKTSIIVRLQREYSSGKWTTISTWTSSNESGASEAGGTKTLTSGYNYRVYVTGKVYDSAGTVIETVERYSTTKSY